MTTGTSIKIVFTEPVKGVSGSTLRLKNLSTGLWVRAKVTYNATKRTATIDPTIVDVPRASLRGRRAARHLGPIREQAQPDRLVVPNHALTEGWPVSVG